MYEMGCYSVLSKSILVSLLVCIRQYYAHQHAQPVHPVSVFRQMLLYVWKDRSSTGEGRAVSESIDWDGEWEMQARECRRGHLIVIIHVPNV